MFGKYIIRAIMIVMILTVWANAQTTAQSYLEPGREALFNGTLSGIRTAAQLFEEGLNDPDCMECQTSRELLFFHGISRIAMWTVHDNGQPVDSGLELAKQVGVKISGDEIHTMTIAEPNIPEDRYGRPVVPDNIEELITLIADFRDEGAIPELAYVIDILDRITETSEDPFVVYLTPSETQVFLDPEMPPYTSNIKVDYGDVLILKGALSMVKVLLMMHSAYDLNVSKEAMLVEKAYEDLFSIQNDLLLPHPEFLKLLPTNNDSSDGKAILAEVRQNMVMGLESYLDALDYLLEECQSAEDGELDHELFAIEQADIYLAEQIKGKINGLLDSLMMDTPYTIDGENYKNYDLTNGQGASLVLDVTIESLGFFKDGFISLSQNDSQLWFGNDEEIEFELVDNRLYGYFDGFVNGYDYSGGYWSWIGGHCKGYFYGLLNEDHSAISEASFEYWGDMEGRIENLTGQLEWQDSEPPFIVNLNPVLGGTEDYPVPISLRDLFCEFSDWNKPVPGTMAQGLGGDPTLGGILPETTDRHWQQWVDPQPCGRLSYPVLDVGQVSDDWPTNWLDTQVVFTDSLDDIEEWMIDTHGLDIHKLYLGMHEGALFGCIQTKDSPAADGNYLYQLSLSPSPKSNEIMGALKIDITIKDGIADGVCFLYENIGGYSQWNYVNNISVLAENNTILFKIPLGDLPCDISGRYLSIDSLWGYSDWWLDEADLNHTHIQVGQTGSITGQVKFSGYRGGPVFVRAFTDLAEPEESLVAYTVLDKPGSFTLDNIGLGLNIYIEGFCPLFGSYHPLDMDALKVSTIEGVLMQSQAVDGIILNIMVPRLLSNDQGENGELFAPYNVNDYYAFDAIAGAAYTLELDPSQNTDVYLSLLDRNGNNVLISCYYWQTQQINWTCPVNGRYYVKVSGMQPAPEGIPYQVRMITDLNCSFADLSESQWSGVKDCRVDIYDFVLLANYWIQGCSEPYWCEGSDINESGSVGVDDIMLMAEQWLEGVVLKPSFVKWKSPDFNADSKSDLVWRNVNTGAYSATQMDGLTLVQNKSLGGSSTTLQIVDFADFNGDGMSDIVWRNVTTGAYSGTLMNGLTLGQTKSFGGSSTTLQIVDTADFNGDGMSDLVWRNVNTGAYIATQMDGLTMVQNKSLGGSSTTLQIVDFADFNGDGMSDILWRNVTTGVYSGTLMNGLILGQTKSFGGSSTTLQIVDTADFNADGKSDLVWRNVNTGSYLATQMDGLTMVQNKSLGGSNTTLQITDFADFNSDGMSDIIWRNINTGAYSGTLMNGFNLGQTKSLGGSSTTLEIVDITDFNADGMSDIVWRNVNTGTYSGTLMNGLTLMQTNDLGGSSTTMQIVIP